MALPSSYFVVQNKISNIMKSLQKAGVPEKFTLSFLESLGYKSTNDRPIIAMLKSLGFLDQNGIPTDVYRAYKNTNNSETILGQKLKETYKEIFLADEKAQDLGVEKLKGIFASVTGKGDSVALKMAQTFKSFCSISNLEDINSINIEEEKVKEAIKENIEEPLKVSIPKTPSSTSPQFCYNVQIHLPVTRDISVYNAIFKSIKEHLM